MSNIAPIVYDADSEAYLDRYPGLREALVQYGPNGARLHWQNYGQKEGRTWGAAAPAASVAPATPVETVSTRPLPASYGTDANSWDAYTTSARQATEGMNQMPGVFSDYGSIPTNDKAANALFYPTSAGAASSGNPLLAMPGVATGGAAFGSVAGADQSNALLSPSQQFARIMDMGPEAFAKPAHQMVDERGGSIAPEDLAFYIKGRDYYGG